MKRQREMRREREKCARERCDSEHVTRTKVQRRTRKRKEEKQEGDKGEKGEKEYNTERKANERMSRARGK